VAITMETVKKLRQKTGAGVMDCKKALQETGGDIDKAVEYLREKGIAAAEKKAGRTAAEGLVGSYIHMGGKIGVLIEVNCETDFVAKTEEFKALVHNLAMQVAASQPDYVSREDIPGEIIDREKSILRQQALEENKPEHVIEKMVEGRLEKFFENVCLLEQPFIKDTDQKVRELLKENIAQLGENIVINRFSRFAVGEEE